MFQDSNSGFEVESHADAFSVADQDLAHHARALLREDLVAEQTYRQLAQELNDTSADIIFGLLVRQTQEHCELLQRIADGTLGDLATKAPANAHLATDSVMLQALCLDIQELARGSRRHAEQLRTWHARSVDVPMPRSARSSIRWPGTATNTPACCWSSRVTCARRDCDCRWGAR